MEFDDDMWFVDDDVDILDIIDIGYPRRFYERENYFESMDDLSFFRRFRLRKPTVMQVLQQIEDQLEFDNDLNNSVAPINQLLTALRFYACGNHQIGIGDFMGMHQTTVSRIVKKVSYAISSLAPHYIRMPDQQECLTVQRDFYSIARFPKVIGCVDGTHIKIQSPGGEDGEVFRNRKGYFSLNVQAVCDSHLEIRDIVTRWPGSTHDMTIFNNSRIRARVEGGEFPNCLLLGDSGYALREYFLTPLAQPVTRIENLYNEAHIRTRNVIERAFGVWKRRFPAMAYGLRCNVQTAMSVIIATAVLNNIAILANEELPPNLEHINEDELEYLIALGNMPDIVAPNNAGGINYRRQLIDNYFANLN